MDFDLTHTERLPGDIALEYGVFSGSERVVLIKSGRGGSFRGDHDKYLRMARHLSRDRGYFVICSSNPVECEQTFDADKRFIEFCAMQMEWSDFSLSLIGNSNGAYQNLFLAKQMPQTQKILCINMPLMVNYHRSAAMLRSMGDVEKTLVYGTHDPSVSYLPFLERWELSRFRIVRVEGADHNFDGRLEDFLALADLIG